MTISLSAPSRRVMRSLSNGVLVIIGACFALPLLWLVLASVDAHPSLAVQMPAVLTLDNFRAVLTPELTFGPLANSLLLSGGAALFTVVVGLLAAYPLSRYRMRITAPFMYGILFGTCLPITAMMVPVYSLFVQLQLIDSLPGTVFFLTASSLPMAIWMLKNFMDSVPVSLEEAAWMDGASSLTTLRRIVVPLMRPGIAVVFIFTFVQAWGNFFVPFVLLLSPDKQPAAVSIFNFFGTNGSVAYGQLAAYSLVYSVPVLALYVLVQRGLGGASALAGAVKG
ncbi:carbohydrate ABC transporter permease [Rathayibacter toxicus]|uniref:carbohydrate ABC transporter permease n=1 Tax=Rathayibacter toxicus TaxID=145458 RepID=UPI000CE83C15|nr:carbohydrate ABC transporter permease [Rathayibacter toxicus]PPI54369.1 sugar ABC transporter permease [Rathayibacter toxicus]QOD10966.1 carbohydrate ABC transporter permease [Rathayibacter toxicus]QWL31920.1 carbohydrate ABC transporter permease [Rathayibacter toxicus]QWL34014.1 carbohydrate ABC transporter permease [Rathayibacter toxicus]QWL36146.1 carbohydrate ABC transporter permease [Rathayibacter toxicus]